MRKMSFGNNGELVSNYINWEAMLSQFLNWYRHENCSDWMAEYRIKVVPDAEYYSGGHNVSDRIARCRLG